jgi:extracellular elastinolytic metalloproteinase
MVAHAVQSENSPPNFDAREDYNRGFRAKQDSEQENAERKLRKQVKDADVEYSTARGIARRIRRFAGPFDGAQSGYQPASRARKFLSDYRKLLGLTAQDDADFEVTDEVVNRDNGASHVYLRQRRLGIPVYDGQLQVDIDGEGRLLSISNNSMRGLASSLAFTKPALSAGQAVTAAAQHLGISPQTPPEVVEAGTDSQQTTRLSEPELSIEEIVARLMWLPIRDKLTRLVWNFQIHTSDGQHVYDFTVDAKSGKVWTRFDWVAPASYRVYPQPFESPDQALPAPPLDGRQTLSNPADPLASPVGWHDTGSATYTALRGNNVYAYLDVLGFNSPTGTQPDCGASLTCVFPIDLSLAPANYRPAVVTNLFYWTNLAHDIFYRYGFDEANGNFQINNFGKGGVGNDYLRAEAQDGGGSCNANFFTPADGSPPRMQLYVCSRATDGSSFFPAHDADLESTVIVHEYGHGVTNRLVGGASNVSCLNNNQQPGEGWSDFFGLAFTVQPGDSGILKRGFANYLFGQPLDGDGIRPKPYSTDSAINDFTYASINGLSIPHGVGSVWAEVLWRMYWRLVDSRGFSADLANPPALSNAAAWAGNQRALLCVVDGLKYTACSPTFVDARDGIIASAAAHFGGEDVCSLWNTFAAFGLGTNAVPGGANSTTPTNGFAVPASCSASPSPSPMVYPLSVTIDPARICLNPVTMAKSGIQTRRQARTWLPEFNLHLAGSIRPILAGDR